MLPWAVIRPDEPPSPRIVLIMSPRLMILPRMVLVPVPQIVVTAT